MAKIDYVKAISGLTRSQIEKILEEWNRIGRDKFLALHKVNRAAKFKIKIDDREYDAKAVLVVALRQFNPALKNLKPVAIDSNEQTIAAPLRSLGFKIIEVSDAQLVGDEQVAAEVRAAFLRLQSRLGEVWRLTQQGKSHREVADVMNVRTKNYVGKLLRFARAIELGDLPTAPTMVSGCRSQFENILEKEGDAMSARTRDALDARRRELQGREGSTAPLGSMFQEVLDLNKNWINNNFDPKMRRRFELFPELKSAVKAIVSDSSNRNNWKVDGKSFTSGSVLGVPYVFAADPVASPKAPKNGFYFVILFAKDGSAMYLSLNQGVTGDLNAPIQENVIRCRAKLGSEIGNATYDQISLADPTGVGSKYEPSNIASIRYSDKKMPTEEEIFDDLSHMLELQEKLYSKSGDEESMNQKLKDLVMGFDSAVEDARLIFAGDNDVLPAVFARGLLAKRFCILGGLAGSGKTQLAKAFGKWLGQTDQGEQRYLIVPVRADWTSPDPLLGFEDALGKPSIDGRKSWNIPEPCKFMINAANEPGRLWLLVLDEMNIAHVERYFSDVLSGIESGEPVIPNVQLEQDGNWRIPSNAAEKIPLPANLVIVGTVNIDETTYQFSPKVLDRSFTFEFRVQTEELSNSANRPASLMPATAEELDLLNQIACDDEWHLDHLSRVEDIYVEIKAVHAMLSKHNFEFGHRAMYEILRFAVLCEQSGLEEEKTIDWAIMTKILPRIHGSAQQLHKLLEEFKTYATSKELNLTLKKVNRMADLARANGFASFAE